MAWRRRWRQLSHEPESFSIEVAKFLDGLVSHLVFDDGKLVVATPA